MTIISTAIMINCVPVAVLIMSMYIRVMVCMAVFILRISLTHVTSVMIIMVCGLVHQFLIHSCVYVNINHCHDSTSGAEEPSGYSNGLRNVAPCRRFRCSTRNRWLESQFARRACPSKQTSNAFELLITFPVRAEQKHEIPLFIRTL